MFDDQLDEEDRQLAMLDERRSMAERQAWQERLAWEGGAANLSAEAVEECLCFADDVVAQLAKEMAEKGSVTPDCVFKAIKDYYVSIRADQIIEGQRK